MTPSSRKPATPRPDPSQAFRPHDAPLAFDFASMQPAPVPEAFLQRCAASQIELEPTELQHLGLYVRLLLAGNESVNLTAVRDEPGAWDRHVLDSLSLLPVLDQLPDGASVIDVGSGGGLPGIPLAITMPRLRFTLLEATGKKAEFLRATVARLGLTNVRVLQARAEGVAQDRGERVNSAGSTQRIDAHREAYDAVVARAVGRLATLVELTVPLAKVGGLVALTKGAKAQEELDEALPALHLLKAVPGPLVPTPTSTIVLIEKPVATPRVYPRADGEPSRSPLGVERQRNKGPKGPPRRPR